MKKLYVAMMIFALSLTVGVTAMAQVKKGHKSGHKAGCSSCDKSTATQEQIKKFKADSIDLRQEMMTKRFDLQRENLKETPDSAKIAAIKADMDAIKVKIDALKAASNLPQSASCCQEDCPLMDGGCDKCSSKKSSDKSARKTADCSNCNKSADCGCLNCSKKGDCDKCAKTADCGCSKKGKGAGK